MRMIVTALVVFGLVCPTEARETVAGDGPNFGTASQQDGFSGFDLALISRISRALDKSFGELSAFLPGQHRTAGRIHQPLTDTVNHGVQLAAASLSDCDASMGDPCIRALLDRAFNDVWQIGDPDVPGEADWIARIVATLAAAKAAAQAIEDDALRSERLAQLAWAERLPQEHYGAIVRAQFLPWIAWAYFAAGLPDEANFVLKASVAELDRLRLLDELDFVPISDDPLSRLAIRQAEAGYLDDALKTADYLPDPWEKGAVLAKLAGALAAANRIEDALAVVHRIDDAERAAWALSEIAASYDLAHRADEVRSVLERFGSEKIYANLIGHLAKAGLFDFAFRLVRQIETLQDRRVAISEIAMAQADAGLVADAITTIGSLSSDMEPAIGRIAVAKAVTGAFAEATTSAARIKAPRIKSETLREIAALQAATGMTMEARKTFLSARTAAETIVDPAKDANFRAQELSAVAEAQARAGFYDDAEETADRIGVRTRRAEAMIAIARHLRETARGSQANRVLRRATLVVAGDASALEQVAAAQTAAGLHEDAGVTWQAAVGALLDGTGSSWISSLSPVGRIAAAQAQIVDRDETYRAIAHKILIAARDASKRYSDTRVNDLVEIAKALNAAGFVDDARATAARVLDGARDVSDVEDRAIELAKAAELQALLDLRSDAHRTFQLARETGAEIDDIATLLEISLGQARSGFADEARHNLRELAGRTAVLTETSDETPEGILRLLCLEVFQALGVGFVYPMTDLSQVAAAQAEAGFLEDSLRTIELHRHACGPVASFFAIAATLIRKNPEHARRW